MTLAQLETRIVEELDAFLDMAGWPRTKVGDDSPNPRVGRAAHDALEDFGIVPEAFDAATSDDLAKIPDANRRGFLAAVMVRMLRSLELALTSDDQQSEQERFSGSQWPDLIAKLIERWEAESPLSAGGIGVADLDRRTDPGAGGYFLDPPNAWDRNRFP